jgi:hypothetical protein
MPPIDWYYAKDNKQFGPVNAVELKRLSQTGELRPEDLVWTDGMKEWSAARKVKGLFDEEPAGPKMAAPPGAKAANPFMAVPSTGASPAGSSAAAAAIPAAAATPSTPLGPFPTAPPAPVQDRPASAEGGTPYQPRHPLDVLLDVARGQFGPSFVKSTERLFAAAGHYGLYAVVLAVLFLFGAMSVKREGLETVLAGLGLALLLLVLQYAAARFIPRIENLSRSGAARLPSGLFLDCTALLVMTVGLSALVILDIEAIRLKSYAGMLAGLMWFVTCEFAGFLALNPGTMAVSIAPGAPASEEALGVFAFLLRLGLRTVPVVFGIGVVSTLILLLYDGYGLLAGKAVLAEGLSPEVLTLQAVGFAALPWAAYLFYLFYYLILDVLRAVLVLPGKLERLGRLEDQD